MLSRAERKRRKATATRRLENAILQLSDLKDILDFNKNLRRRAIDVSYRLLLLHKTLSEKK